MELEVQSVELPGEVRLEFVEQGEPSGTPVLLLHGTSDSWHSFELVLPHLPESIRAVALSQRGQGDSGRPAHGYAARDFASDALAVLDALGIDAAVVVGHSAGSLAARRLAIEHPERVLGLVLASTFGRPGDSPPVGELQEVVSALADPVNEAFVREFQASTIARPIPEAFFETVVTESRKVPARVWKALVAGVSEDDSFDELHKIQAPVLIVWGDRDAVCSRADQEAVARALRSRFEVYRDVGHALHWEEPERFASDLARFVGSVAR